MNKDTIVASILGLGLGLVAAIALWIVPRMIPKNSSSSSASPTTEVVSSVEPEASSQAKKEPFTISNPADGTISNADSVTINGTAEKATVVIISSTVDQKVIKPAENGSFSAEMSLSTGSNEIAVTMITENKTQEVKKITVFKSDEEI